MDRRKLLIETLEVDSFVVGPASPRIGTVRAFADAYFVEGEFADQPAPAPTPPQPKYTEEGYPAFTCTGWNCTLPGLCTCPISCDPAGCSQPPGCV